MTRTAIRAAMKPSRDFRGSAEPHRPPGMADGRSSPKRRSGGLGSGGLSAMDYFVMIFSRYGDQTGGSNP